MSKKEKTNNVRLNKEARKLLQQCFAAQLVFTVALLLVLAFVKGLFNTVIWYWENPLYRFLKFFEERDGIFIPILLLIGWFPITYHFMSKLLKYLDEVAMAAGKLAAPTSEPIELSDALHYTENELNRVREQALESARVAKEAEQRKNDLVAYLAHDLKTPLTSVIGYLTILKEEGEISDALREKYLTISLSKAERLEDLINEFFEITRFNISDITLNYSKVNLTLLLQQLASEFQPMLREKHLQCRLDLAQGMMISCDVDKMQRVFDNLLRNAVNYSYPGTDILIHAYLKADRICVKFQNHGDTIPQEKLACIFQQFYRVDASRSSSSGGTGLGLAIAKEIVEHHGGSIQARSEDNTVEFTVEIPSQQPESAVGKS